MQPVPLGNVTVSREPERQVLGYTVSRGEVGTLWHWSSLHGAVDRH